jgi:hypothetical protein
MLSSVKKANELLTKELDDYHRREAEMKKREEELEVVVQQNEALKE